MSEHGERESYDVSIEVKRGKTNEEEEVEESINKKKVPSGKKAVVS